MNHVHGYRKFMKFGAAAICAVGLLAGAIALAANPRIQEAEAERIDEDTIRVTGTATGLGDAAGEGGGEVVVTLTGVIITRCRNPGQQLPPGRNRFEIEVTEPIQPDDIDRNGRYEFDITIDNIPVSDPDVEGAPECPNGNWTQEQDVTLSDITIEVRTDGRDDRATCDVPEDEGDVDPCT